MFVCFPQTQFEMDGEKLVQKQLGKIPSTITREMEDDDTMVAVSNSKRRFFPLLSAEECA